MTGVYSTDEPKYAYGGGNEGAMGDVMRNAVTIDLAHVADLVEEAYGGMASAEDNTGAVDHNTANMKNGTTRLLYGSYTFGKGAVTNNEVHFEGGTSTEYVMGGYLDNTASTAEMMGNKVVFTNGTAAEIVGADSKGEGKLSGNTATFGGAGSVAEILRGALAENQAAVEGNAGTIMSGYGASAERNRVDLKDGTAHTVYGGDATTGDAVRNNVTITGGTVTDNIYGGQSLGGAIPDPASPLGMKANPNGKGNTLAIHAAGTKIADFAGVQNLRFYVPEERTAVDPTSRAVPASAARRATIRATSQGSARATI